MSTTTTMRIMLAPGPWPGEDYARSWPVGGEITGELVIKSHEGQRATNVAVELEWETDGRGTRNHKQVAKQILHEGNIPPLADLRLPFKLAVPSEGPISYHGHYIELHWKVIGRVDIKWAVDYTEDETVSVLPIYDQD